MEQYLAVDVDEEGCRGGSGQLRLWLENMELRCHVLSVYAEGEEN